MLFAAGRAWGWWRNGVHIESPICATKELIERYMSVVRSRTGPKTEAGRQRCAEAKTIHGREAREARTERSLASARLAVLEAVGFSIGLMSGGRTRGRRPDRMEEAYQELQKEFCSNITC
jgi:hypothetical protein